MQERAASEENSKKGNQEADEVFRKVRLTAYDVANIEMEKWRSYVIRFCCKEGEAPGRQACLFFLFFALAL